MQIKNVNSLKLFAIKTLFRAGFFFLSGGHLLVFFIASLISDVFSNVFACDIYMINSRPLLFHLHVLQFN